MRARHVSFVLGIAVCSAAVASPPGPEWVPDPISASELASHAFDLDVSRRQWLEILQCHASYRVAYYREIVPEVRELEAAMGLLAAAPPNRPEDLAADFQAAMTLRSRLFSKIERLDTAYFESLGPLLNDQQRHGLGRIRLARERDRLRGEALLQGVGIDVIDAGRSARMLLRVEPGGAEDGDVEAIVLAYEQHLTALERKLQRRSEGVYERFVSEISKAGIATDAAALESTHNQRAAIWLEVTGPARTTLRAIHALNRRLFRDLEGPAPVVARRLRHAFCRAVCNDTSMAAMLKLGEGWEDAVSSVRGLTLEEQEALETGLESWTSSFEQLVDGCLLRLEEIWEADNLTAGQAAQDTCADYLARAAQKHADFVGFLSALLGPRSDRLVAAVRPWSPIAGIDGPWRYELVGDWTREFPRAGVPRLRVPHVELTDLERLAARLNWGPDRLKQLAAAYMTFDQQFRAEIVRQTRILDDAYAGRVAATGDRRTPSEARALAAPALHRVDAALWDRVIEINGMQDTTAIRLARGLRRRELLHSVPWHDRARLPINVSQEWRSDLVAVLDGMGIAAAAGSALESCLHDYDAKATAIAAGQHDAALALLDLLEVDGTGDGPPLVEDDRLRSAQDALDAAYAKGIDLNRRTLEKLKGLLPADRGERLVAAYGVLAYAQLLDDPYDVSPLLTRAMVMEGLDEETRALLVQAGQAYLGEYRSLLDDIRERLSLLDQTPLLETRREMLHTHRGELSRFSFRRFDLNTSVMMFLESLLTEEQLAEIGGSRHGLPDTGPRSAPDP